MVSLSKQKQYRSMPERKVWTEDQDKILRHLREDRKEKKWANIARIMQQEFGIVGRTGKQCRQRYHNHLDSSIVNTEWTHQQEELLFNLHEEIGNKWSTISQKIPGRSDNCIKNHFYSKLRKAVRKLNKIIQDLSNFQFRIIKNCMLSKIIQITECKFKINSKEDQEFVDLCSSIKNRLFKLDVQDVETLEEQEMTSCKELIEDIELFDRQYRKNHKSSKKYATEKECKMYLKPPKPVLIKRQNSNGSCSSEFSDDGSSFLSSGSCISSCSDLSEYDIGSKGSVNSTLKGTPSSSTGNIKVELQQQMAKSVAQDPEQFEKLNENLIEQESQNELMNNGSKNSLYYQYNNMFYDDTPVMARIIGPSYSNMDEEPQSALFKHRGSDSQDLAFSQEKP